MKTGPSHKVLVVEDEGLIALDIASRLEALGHEVIATASTAEEAIERAAGADIVLMDIRLDGPADGIEAAAEIRKRYHIPVVFLTGQADRSTLDRAKLAEPFGYIVKPLAPASLQTNIEVAIYKHGMERQLAKQEAWLRTTLGSVGDAVIVTGVDSRIRMLNRAAEVMTGWIQPEAEGQPLSNVARLMDRDFEDEGTDPVPLAILRDAAVSIENWVLVARTGREIVVDGSVAPVKSNGSIDGVVLTLRDVSARRWEERQLRQSQRLEAAGRLASGVSTEYGTLLSTIRSQAEQLLRQFGDYSPARKAAEQIQQAAAEAEQINRRLASFSTRQVSRQEILSLNGMLRRASKLLESMAGSKIELSLRPQPGTGKIKADAAQMEQAITSLVLHACAVMPEGGRLLIETGNAEVPMHGRLGNYVILALTHTGHEPEPEKLFEPSSTGLESLALPMVHAIVTEHGGYISARATAAGGSRFEMLLPRWSGPALLPRPALGEAPCILLIDARENVRSHLHNFFEASGYNLLEAADAAEALALSGVHEGALRLLIADAAQAALLAGDLERAHPALAVLRIVDGPEAGPHEIRRPFTQQTLLSRVEELLKPSPQLESATAG